MIQHVLRIELFTLSHLRTDGLCPPPAGRELVAANANATEVHCRRTAVEVADAYRLQMHYRPGACAKYLLHERSTLRRQLRQVRETGSATADLLGLLRTSFSCWKREQWLGASRPSTHCTVRLNPANF